MSGLSIRALKDKHKGQKIYVVCSGASMNYIPAAFFRDEVVVTVNEMFRHVRGDYALMHHHENGQEAIHDGCVLVTSDVSYDMPPEWGRPHEFDGQYFVYRTTSYEMSLEPRIDLERVGKREDDELVVSACTSAEAVQFAAHLGASSIVLCGADGGALDGRFNLQGYNHGAGTNPQHIRLTENILLDVVQLIRAGGIPVVSLNPFMNLGLEGHEFTRPKVKNGEALVRALQTVYPS